MSQSRYNTCMSKPRNSNDSLFQSIEAANTRKAQPLAARMRPRTLDEFIGQEHFLGPGKLLRRLVAADRVGSIVLHGPPGSGKTSLAHVIAAQTQSRFVQLSAVAGGVKELREALQEARNELAATGRRTILFVDELHHFNRSQQDLLLPDVEEGRITLLGATTQNPFFSINGPLLSRSQIFSFEALSREHIREVLQKALADRERGLGNIPVQMNEDALAFLAEISDGDARRALTALEIGVLSAGTPPVEFTLQVAQESIQRKALMHDGTGDEHYDVISAFIKSLRGSDPDAAIYWLARMLEAGEDPRYLARRLIIFASEDVGNADPLALPLAAATVQAVEFVGLPECQLNLAQAVTYLASAPKSNASTLAIGQAREDVKSGRTLAVPKHLRDGHYQASKVFGHGEGYEYSHDHPDAWSAQDYLPEARRYYEPVERGHEALIKERLDELRRRKAAVEHQSDKTRGDDPSQQ